ncbi:hypothetical protein [Suttonella sp. R2A3]|nr:hypothetical protein [Suttonella sp. R2A3]
MLDIGLGANGWIETGTASGFAVDSSTYHVLQHYTGSPDSDPYV